MSKYKVEGSEPEDGRSGGGQKSFFTQVEKSEGGRDVPLSILFSDSRWLLKYLSMTPPLVSLLLSGVGTRNYYRKMGYELEGPYMVKHLQEPGQ